MIIELFLGLIPCYRLGLRHLSPAFWAAFMFWLCHFFFFNEFLSHVLPRSLALWLRSRPNVVLFITWRLDFASLTQTPVSIDAIFKHQVSVMQNHARIWLIRKTRSNWKNEINSLIRFNLFMADTNSILCRAIEQTSLGGSLRRWDLNNHFGFMRIYPPENGCTVRSKFLRVHEIDQQRGLANLWHCVTRSEMNGQCPLFPPFEKKGHCPFFAIIF